MPDSVLHTECVKNRHINTMKLNVSDVVESREEKKKKQFIQVIGGHESQPAFMHAVSYSIHQFWSISETQHLSKISD